MSSAELHPTLIDQYGIISDQRNNRLHIPVINDQPPTVVITDPTVDQSLTPTAIINLSAETRDDVHVDTVLVQANVIKADQTTQNEQQQSPHILTQAPGQGRVQTIKTTLEISQLDVQPGDVVEVISIATDGFDLNNQTHEPVTSTPRRFRIISQVELIKQVAQDLAEIREQAINVSEHQQRLRNEIAEMENESAIPSSLRSQQSLISQQIIRQREIINRIKQTLQTNQVHNEQEELVNAVSAVRESLNQAGRSSNEAEEILTRLTKKQEPTDQTEKLKHTAEKQDEVLDALTDLIDRLDQGQDTWALQHLVDRLLSDQQNLTEKTEQITTPISGQHPDELTDSQKQTLTEAARQQQDITERSQSLINRLRETAARLNRNDQPQTANAMQQTADQAERNQLIQNMQTAARRIESNQGQLASSNQQIAIETLREMKEQLDEADRIRAEQIQNQLNNLLASIKELIDQQTIQLETLENTQIDAAFTPLAQAMSQLRSDTSSVADQIKTLGQSLSSALTWMHRAQQAQDSAITSLQSQPVQVESAGINERRSLTSLTEAHNLVQEMQKHLAQKAVAQQLQILQKAYEQLLAQQQEVLTQTTKLNDSIQSNNQTEPTRRQRFTLGQIANKQDEIRTGAATLLNETKDLADSLVFSTTHHQFNQLAENIIKNLLDGSADQTVQWKQRDAVNLLSALVDALKTAEQEDSELAEDQNAGGQGGSGDSNTDGSPEPPPLIPPIAQIKLVRNLQQSIHQSTQEIDKQPTSPTKTERIKEVGQSQQNLAQLTGNYLIDLQRKQLGLPPKDHSTDEREPPKPIQPDTDEPPESETPDDLPTNPTQLFTETVQHMDQSAGHLTQNHDSGNKTQRHQTGAITRLDQLIKLAEQQQQSSQSSPKEEQQNTADSEPSQQPEPDSEMKKSEGAMPNQGQTTPAQQREIQTNANDPIEQWRTEWGSLPDRIRQMLLQGRSEEASGLYRTLTEQYYQRLAEESQPE